MKPLSSESAATLQRLTLLWALSESGLGGVFHALRSPFTGLVVGGLALLLIRLLAEAAGGDRRQILKATAIVLLVKFSVSPHSPVNAYLAVAFQGALGALLLGRPGFGRPALLAFTFIACAQMALQKLVVTTLLYGFSLWEAIDRVALEAARHLPELGLSPGFHASLLLVGIYAGIHLLAGLVLGLFAWRLPDRLRSVEPAECLREGGDEAAAGPPRRRPFLRRLAASLPILVFLGLVWWLLPEGGSGAALRVLLRALIMIGLWYVLVSPLLLGLLRRLLRGRASRYAGEIDFVLEQLPGLRRAAGRLWSAGNGRSAPRRFLRTGAGLMAWALAGTGEAGRG